MSRCLAPAATALVGAIAALLQAACSTLPRVEAMVVDDVALAARHAPMAVRVESGSAVTVGPMVDLPLPLLASAIEKSLRGSAAEASAAEATAPGNAGPVLTVTVHDMSRAGGFDISVDAISVWTISSSPGWQYTAAGSGTASFGEAVWGFTRLRIATERAAQAMIRDGLEALRRHAAGAVTR